MIIPNKIKVLYKNYKIRQVENLHSDDGELYGQVRYLDEVIDLSVAASEDQKKCTLVHEIIHAIDETYCIGLKEKQVEKLGVALYMLILDNEEIFEREEV